MEGNLPRCASLSQAMTITLSEEVLSNDKGGGGISIKVPGFKGNPDAPDDGQIFVEYYEGKLRVHVWNGQPNPVTTECPPEDSTKNIRFSFEIMDIELTKNVLRIQDYTRDREWEGTIRCEITDSKIVTNVIFRYTSNQCSGEECPRILSGKPYEIQNDTWEEMTGELEIWLMEQFKNLKSE